MTRPWLAERAIPEDLARSLIETQFPELAPASLEPLGDGWDNTAYRVNGQWVFRFPRRAIAVDLIRTERKLLPLIAAQVPLPVPEPTKHGHADERYPWPFAGYGVLPGRTACAARLDERQRADAAEPIAGFLAALHAIDVDAARRIGAPGDTIRRLDVAHRSPQLLERLEQCRRLGLIEDARPWAAIVEEAPRAWTPGHASIVHGDLYARHLLVDGRGRPAGVIDWGDAHLGDPAIDLAIAHGFLPPSAREAFRRAYGPIDDDAWRIARFKALHSAVLILVYGHDVGDADLLDEGKTALGHLAAPG